MATRRAPAPSAGRSVGVLVGAWLVLCAAVVGIGRLLTGPLADSVGKVDDDVVRWFADQRTPTLDTVGEIGTFFGDTLAGIVVLLLLGIGFSRWRRTWLPLVFVTVGYAGLMGVYLVATHLDPRDRPPVEILDKGLVPNHSFPSGHTMTSTAVVWTLVLLLRTYTHVSRAATLPLVLVPVFTMLARMYQGAHHPTDVLTALAFALGWLSVVTVVLFRPQLPGGRGGEALAEASRDHSG